jgi:hypothetical protein
MHGKQRTVLSVRAFVVKRQVFADEHRAARESPDAHAETVNRIR